MSNPAAKRVLEIIEKKEKVTQEEMFKLWDELPPVDPDQLYKIKEWWGDEVDTGHMTGQWVKDVRFAGKTFHSANEVDPVWVFDKDDSRVFHEPSGHARIREVRFRKNVTATLIYNDRPTEDYFARVTDRLVLSTAWNRAKPIEKHGAFFFWLSADKPAKPFH